MGNLRETGTGLRVLGAARLRRHRLALGGVALSSAAAPATAQDDALPAGLETEPARE